MGQFQTMAMAMPSESEELDLEALADKFLAEKEAEKKAEIEAVKNELFLELDEDASEIEELEDTELYDEVSSEAGRSFLFEKWENNEWVPCQNKVEQKEYMISLYDEYYLTGDIYIINDVLTHNMEKLIRSIIYKKCNGSEQDMEDAFQSANLAVLMDAPNYDPRKAEPSTYFYFRILRTVLNEQVEQSQSSSHYKATFNKVKKAINDLQLEGHLTVTNEMIAEKTGLSLKRIEAAIEKHQFTFISQIEDSSGDYRDAYEYIEATEYLPEEIIQKEYMAQVKREVMALLTGEEKEFAMVYYGFIDTYGYFKTKSGEKRDAVNNVNKTCEYLGISRQRGVLLQKNIQQVFEKYRMTHDIETGAIKLQNEISKKPKRFIPTYPGRAKIDSIMSQFSSMEFSESLVDQKKSMEL